MTSRASLAALANWACSLYSSDTANTGDVEKSPLDRRRHCAGIQDIDPGVQTMLH